MTEDQIRKYVSRWANYDDPHLMLVSTLLLQLDESRKATALLQAEADRVKRMASTLSVLAAQADMVKRS